MKRLLTFFLVAASMHSLAQSGEWTWMKGSSSPNATGVFGTKGVSAPANTPPALYGAALWLDASNNIWLFGGAASYNTLWKYDIGANQWTWMNGTSINSSPGVYGTMGVPAAANTPGARGFGFPSWKDLNGDFWIYGGDGYDVNGNEGLLNDLWRYSVATNEWTWMNGSTSALPAQPPNYGTFQVPSATNTPGGREETTVNWVDAAGNLWFFGGFDNNISTKADVWKYDMALNQWVWMAGDSAGNVSPVYGTLGVSSPLNTPGGRNAYSSWKDLSGNFWLFGGSMLAGGTADLWKFDPSSLEWTWMGGSDVINATGNAGNQCVSDTSFYPTSRSENRACWKDACGNFWMFGGTDYHNDLWAYRPNSGDWTFANGTLIANASASYGTQGISSPSNNPGGRYGSPGVYDLSDHAWIFGGHFSAGNIGNDLWRFVQDTTCPALPGCGAFLAPGFFASDTNVCEKFCIDFTDQSNNNPFAWQWLFPGGNPSSSTAQNPSQVCYDSPGVYDVTLITTNTNGTDTLTLFNYVTVNATPAFPVITQNGYVLTSTSAYSYQWQLNASDIPGATDQSYTVTQSGLYTVIVGDSNGCVNSISQYVLLSGISEVMNDENISIYPNPSSGTFTVEFSWANLVSNATKNSWVEIRVVNTLGQIIFSSEHSRSARTSQFKKEIHFDAPAGIYFIEIKFGNSVASPGFFGIRKKILID